MTYFYLFKRVFCTTFKVRKDVDISCINLETGIKTMTLISLPTGDCAKNTAISRAFRRTERLQRTAKSILVALNRHIERGVPHDKFSWTMFL